MSALDGWMDVCRTGRWHDMTGREIDVSESTLDELVTRFTGSDPVPVVVGHPKTDSPAYGWVAELRRVGDRLQARLRDLVPAFRRAVEAGQYTGRSISFGPRGLRHVGFLGGAAPAVPGLAPSRFSGPAGEAIEFAAGDEAAVLADFASTKLHRQHVALAEREASIAAHERRVRVESMVRPHVEAGRVLPVERELVTRLGERLLGDEETISFAWSGGTIEEGLMQAFERFLANLPERVRYAPVIKDGDPIPPMPSGSTVRETHDMNHRVAQRARELMQAALARGEALGLAAAVDLASTELEGQS